MIMLPFSGHLKCVDLELSKSTLVEEIILFKFHPTLKRLNRPCAKLNMITSPHTDYAYKVYSTPWTPSQWMSRAAWWLLLILVQLQAGRAGTKS